ncbi:MAG: hypothetical protein ACRBB3_04915 [Alphaproteobacteria bacterium]
MQKVKHIHLFGILFILCLGFSPATAISQPPSKEKSESPSKEEVKKTSGKIGTKDRTEMPDELKKEANKIEWRLHKSITGIFETKFPLKYKYNIFPFQFSQNEFVSSAEIISALDGNIGTKSEKSLLIKTTQTFGSELTYKEMKEILERSARRYVTSAKSINGAVLTNKDIKHKGFLGRDVYISYKVKGEKYGLRIRIYITNFSKIEQVLSGPAHTMYSYRSDDFFDTMTPYDGRATKENIPLGYGWIDHTSKSNIFTVKLPPQNKDYTPFPPKFTIKDGTEVMRFILVDPVTEERANYNVYSYKDKKAYAYSSVKALLFSKHVAKFVKNVSTDSLNVKTLKVDGDDAMWIKLVITPTDQFPNITTIVLQAVYRGNVVTIQEFLSTKKNSKSALDKTFFPLMKFHPEKRNTPVKKQEADASETKTIDEDLPVTSDN